MLNQRLLLFVIVLLPICRLKAQLCKGSLGDPIININFGAGPNPGPSLTTTKNLNYIAGDCPGDGFYTIRNSTNGCFGNTWHRLSADHTGSTDGYFMLINASFQKSDFYIDTLKGLCPNTTYEFAAWVMNVQLPTAPCGTLILPNLTFNIETTDGVVLQKYSTGDIAATSSALWNQYGSFFTTPANVSNVVLRLINNSVGGCGNDIAIDDITFRPCGPQLTPSIRGVTGLVKELCVGQSADVILDCSVSAGYANPTNQWQQSKDSGKTWVDIPGENRATLVTTISSATPVGRYLYRLSVGETINQGIANCRVASAALTLNVNNNPVTSVTTNSPVCQGNNVVLSASSGGDAASYDWSGPNSYSASGLSVVISNVQTNGGGKYYVKATSSKGCAKSDSTTVTVKPAPDATTAFSSKTICQGDSVLLGSSGGILYKWSPLSGLSSSVISNPVARPSASTVYTVVVANAELCSDSAAVTINVISKPVVHAGPDKVVVEGQSVQLEGRVVGSNASITWSPGLFINNSHILQPVVSPANNTSYVLTATSTVGCGSSSDTTNVHVYKNVVIPNAFSPNGDGINDSWNITALTAYNDYELSVFNRYGQIVYSTKNYSQPWNGTYNGKPLPVATYYYLLDLKLGMPKRSGYVVILR